MLLTLLLDYLGVMSFAPLSCPPRAGVLCCVILPAWGHEAGSWLLENKQSPSKTMR